MVQSTVVSVKNSSQKISPGSCPVLDKGFVCLDAAMADDLSVVNSARVSFAKRSYYEQVRVGDQCYCEDSTKVCDCFEYRDQLKQEDIGLIKYLMQNRHGTPFEHNAFRFHIKCPLFVGREWVRHRIGSFNEMSGRYTKLEAEFYIPDEWNVRTQEGKPGAYSFKRADADSADAFRVMLSDHCDNAWSFYEHALENGIAKEQARFFLPVNVYTQFYWTINARSLMNFLSLRNAEAAMWEIAEYAKVIESIFAIKMPETCKAFVVGGRIAP
ncbi:MAG: FAD-dependent thymidylate synthase [Patescibacteria group bacterium]|nr:FAD-dependent thymidylate synthase [Patescibacteria group bacterium]